MYHCGTSAAHVQWHCTHKHHLFGQQQHLDCKRVSSPPANLPPHNYPLAHLLKVVPFLQVTTTCSVPFMRRCVQGGTLASHGSPDAAYVLLGRQRPSAAHAAVSTTVRLAVREQGSSALQVWQAGGKSWTKNTGTYLVLGAAAMKVEGIQHRVVLVVAACSQQAWCMGASMQPQPPTVGCTMCATNSAARMKPCAEAQSN